MSAVRRVRNSRCYDRTVPRLIALLCVAACGAPDPVLTNAPAPAQSATPPPTAAAPPPTLATAGGACKLLLPRVLGTIVEDHAPIAFGAASGLAAWFSEAAVLSLQPLALDGAPRGAAATVAVVVDAGLRAEHVFALDRGFLVLLLRWDWQRAASRWWALFVDRDGRAARPPAAIGLDRMTILRGQPLDADRVGLIVSSAFPDASGRRAPSRWQTLTVASDGRISSTPVAVHLDDLVARSIDWLPSIRAGQRGWSIDTDGVFEGVRTAAAPRSVDPIDAHVGNRAQPIPSSGGRTIEPLARPVLARTRAGSPLGDDLDLQVDGNPVGVTGFMMSGTLFWSGTHFLYSYPDGRTAKLLPIDCRK